MLFQYLERTQQLLSDLREVNFNTYDLTNYVNIARGQLAGDSECIRVQGSLALTLGTRIYPFSSINVSGGPAGVAGVFNVRQSLFAVGTGYQLMRGRGFEWFTLYKLNNPVPGSGQPVEWSQYGQGVTGSLYIDPLPDASYALQLDASCYPVQLVDDTTAEAIPYPWTDAVPFFAAYWALQTVPMKEAQERSDTMMKMYQTFKNNARSYSNPSVNPGQWPQSSDPTLPNRLNIRGGG